MARVAVKAVCEGKPLSRVTVTISVQAYQTSWTGVTSLDGQAVFEVPVGGLEAGRWAEPGVMMLVRASKVGYVGPSPFTEMLFGDKSYMLVFRRG